MADRKAQEAHLKREDWRQEIGNYSASHRDSSFRNSWESKVDRKGLHSRVQMEVERVQAEMEEELEQRRDRLSELLGAEEDMYLREAACPDQETEEEKTARMLARYKELQIEKETERRKIAKEKKEQQFKLNCEEYRTLLSKRLQRETAVEGQQLISEKRRQAALKTREEGLFAELWIRDSEAKLGREKEESENRKKKGLEFGKQIRDQMLEKDLERSRRLKDREGDAEIMAEQARLAGLEEDCAKQSTRQKKETAKRALDECLRAKLKRKAKQVQDDLLQDLFFLKQIMDNEEETKTNEKKRALMHEQQEYLKYLRDRAIQEAEFEETIDRMCQEELEKVWSKRQKEWEEEKRKGRRMEEDVVKCVQNQITANMERGRLSQALHEEYSKKILEEDEKDRRKEVEKLRIIRERNKIHQKKLLEQIKEREEKLNQEKRENEKELEILRKANEQEETKIKDLLENMRIEREHPYRVCRREVFNDCGD